MAAEPKYGTSDATCPYCGYGHRDSWEWEDGEHQCDRCDRRFDVEKYVECSFNSRPMIHCDTCGRLVGQLADGLCDHHTRYGVPRPGKCPGSRQPGKEQEAPRNGD